MLLPNDISPELAPLLEGDPFAKAFALEGEVFRNVKNRRTVRFRWNGKDYFIKMHRGVGWREIFKNLFQLKRPVLGAANEYLAIRKLESLGVDTMKVYAFAERVIERQGVQLLFRQLNKLFGVFVVGFVLQRLLPVIQ